MDLSSLRTRRGQIKAKNTRILAFLSQAEQPELNKVNQVKDRLDKFVTSFDEFNEVQTQIEELDKAELNGDEREQFEDAYFSILARCNSLISVLNEKTEEECSSDEPTFSDLEKFLNERAQVLESIECKRQTDKPGISAKSCLSSQLRCADCSKGHKISSCELFLAKDMSQRLARVKQLKLCINCLQSGHFMMNCRSSSCRKCAKKHHTLLHMEKREKELSAIDCNFSAEKGQTEIAKEPSKSVSTATLNSIVNVHDTLLSTAMVLLLSSDGKFHKARVLLDSGSQVNFVTQNLVNKLKLSSRSEELALIGIGGTCRNINSAVTLNVKSIHNNFKMNIKCYILPTITGKLPASELENSLQIPNGITLADPNFYQPQNIDILIGSELFYNLLCIGQIKLGTGMPVLQKTTLGWIIAGEISQGSKQRTSTCNFSLLEKQLTKFWEVEDLNQNQLEKGTTAEETLCEESFKQYCRREDNGRFMVAMPFKSQPIKLGESFNTALNRLKSMERKFARNEKLREGYCNFMKEYEELNHMSKLDSDNINQGYYLPHHAVINESSLTTKLRVVFDGSAATSTGSSLNNIQCVGPQLQENLFNIIIRFRCHAYVMTADIAKMYRQVLIIPEHRKYQKILWRTSPSNQINSFQLNTVTYGMKASSFLPIRCLKELANEFRSTYPSASTVIEADFYVNDLITGANDLCTLRQLKQEIELILQSGCFELRKWSSNTSDIFDNSDDPDHSTYRINPEISHKTLGLIWTPSTDQLQCLTQGSTLDHRITKRSILSITAQFTELHCFADASEVAYGSCLYIRSIDPEGSVEVNLLCSRSRVAPLCSISLPRLELCAAVLLAELVKKVQASLRFEIHKIYFWSDSMIVLSWIKSEPRRWKTFVFNRVAKIQRHSQPTDWNHTISSENPADLISRGTSPQTLLRSKLWWHGPKFLQESEEKWPIYQPIEQSQPLEERTVQTLIGTKIAEQNHTL